MDEEIRMEIKNLKTSERNKLLLIDMFINNKSTILMFGMVISWLKQNPKRRLPTVNGKIHMSKTWNAYRPRRINNKNK